MPHTYFTRGPRHDPHPPKARPFSLTRPLRPYMYYASHLLHARPKT
nr:MAG TPA: hypothetical protein [Caudoviricetes sp.]